MDAVRDLTQKELGTELPNKVYESAEKTAREKLERIIERNGDAGGARRSAQYLAILVAEEVKAEMLTAYCKRSASMNEDKDKKRAARMKANDSDVHYPHYSTTRQKCQGKKRKKNNKF